MHPVVSESNSRLELFKTLSRDDLIRLLSYSFAVFIQDEEREVMDTMMCLNIPVAGIDEGPDLSEFNPSNPLELSLGYFDSEGKVAEQLYWFSEEELTRAQVENGGRSLRFNDGLRISFLSRTSLDDLKN